MRFVKRWQIKRQQVKTPPAVQAYTLAGHALMAYLISEAGLADHIFALPIHPADRAFLVPEFDALTLGSDLSELDRPSPSLRSLLTMPLFLLGGTAADRIREHISEDAPLSHSRAVSRAAGMLAGYFEEFGGPAASHDRDKLALALIGFYQFTEREVAKHWRAVEALAARISSDSTVSKHDAFRLFDTLIPKSKRAPTYKLGSGPSRQRPT